MSHATHPPGPKTRNPLGHLYAVRRDIIGFLTSVARDFGDIAYFRVGRANVVLLNHPDLIRDVLVTHQRLFVKGRPLRLAKQMLGEGLLTSEGKKHAHQRKVITPAFRTKRLESYATVMTDYATEVSDSWQDGSTVDVCDEMIQMATAIAGKTLFGREFDSGEVEEIGQALTSAMSLFSRVPVPLAEWLLKLPLPSTIRFHRAKRHLNTLVYDMIDKSKRTADGDENLVSMLLQAQDYQGESGVMSDEQVRDEVLTLFLTALDTTSLALTWTWYMLSQHPAVERTLHEEVDRVLGDRAPGVSDLQDLPYTRAVLSEALRLYPPLYVIAREAQEEYAVGNYVVPAGCLILMSPYLMHHDERYFRDSYAFDPHRWAPEVRVERPRFAYFPFGGGPRVCIGEAFAWMEGVLVLATLARSWQLRLATGHDVQLEPLLNLRPRHGMPMVLERRSATPS